MRPLLLCLALLLLPASGASAAVLDTWGPAGNGEGQIGAQAQGVAVAPDGSVLVADRKAGRIRRFAPDGTPAGSFVPLATAPTAVAAASDGSVVVGGTGGLWRHDPDGTVRGRIAAIAISDVRGLAIDPRGGLVVTDALHGRVTRVAADGSVTTLATGLREPTGVAVAPDGTIYVSESGVDRVRHLATDGAVLSSLAVSDPDGVAVTPDGVVHVASTPTHRVLSFTAAGAPAGTEAGFNRPRGVAADCRGGVWVLDNSNVRVQRVGPAGTPPPPCPAPPAPPAPAAPVEPPKVAVLGARAESLKPVLGVSAIAQRVSGKVLAGGKVLVGPSLIPIGTKLDTTAGRVRLTFATHPSDFAERGRTQTGEFYDGAFTIHQAKSATLVELRLTEVATGCGAKARKSATKRARLWGSAKGKFRTTGRHGTAAVRGTVWLTEERCGGTRVRVREGVVRVRENDSGRDVDVAAGEEFVARPACLSKRVFTINLQVPVGTRLSRVEVKLGGKPVPVTVDRRTGRPTARIDLRGRRKGSAVVRITVVTASGERLRGTRTYRTCSESQPGGNPPL